MAGWLTGTALLTAWVSRPGPCQLWPLGAGPCAKPGFGLGTGELGGDALGLLQKRVDVLCLDELVGLQMLKGPGAAHRQTGRGRCPGIGEIHDDEPVVLAEHQVVR